MLVLQTNFARYFDRVLMILLSLFPNFPFNFVVNRPITINEGFIGMPKTAVIAAEIRPIIGLEQLGQILEISFAGLIEVLESSSSFLHDFAFPMASPSLAFGSFRGFASLSEIMVLH